MLTVDANKYPLGVSRFDDKGVYASGGAQITLMAPEALCASGAKGPTVIRPGKVAVTFDPNKGKATGKLVIENRSAFRFVASVAG